MEHDLKEREFVITASELGFNSESSVLTDHNHQQSNQMVQDHH